LGLAHLPAAAQVPAGKEQVVSLAESFLRKLEAQDGAGAMALVGPQRKAAGVTAEMLTVSWKQLSGGAPLSGLRASAVNEIQGYQAVDFAAQFGERVQWFRVSVSAQHQVEGFRVIPQSAGAPWEPPRYARRDAFEEVELTVGAEGWPLGATLTLPKAAGKVPVVVLVHGSGPNDRNEMVGGVQVFHDLAWGLASNGVAVLRYDKRTFRHGARLVGQPITVTEEVIADALTALAKVREQYGIDPNRVYLLGHSLGGMLAPEIAVQDGELAGVILMAGATRSLPALAIEQLDYIATLPESQAPAAQQQLAQMRAMLVKVEKHELAPTQDAGGAPASYFYDLEQRAPVQFVPRLKGPVLVLQGGRDYQVTKTDYDAWQAALAPVPGVRFRWYEDLNHLFVTGQGKATPAEYATSRGHVDARVIADIAEFVKLR
ncbi:MAG: alpha/beta fold hydrolase, partial [Gemmatimonadetes bacterium]|nr:alpha/beta fold hydrolase [Gemmatimonadota bacterium]